MKELIARTKSNISVSQVHDYYPGTSNRIVIVSGTLSAVSFSQSLVCIRTARLAKNDTPDEDRYISLEALQQAPEDVMQHFVGVKISIPEAAAGILIGRNGDFVKMLSAQAGATVKFAENVTMNERLVHIDGPCVSCIVAINLILEKMVSEPHMSRYTNYNASYMQQQAGMGGSGGGGGRGRGFNRADSQGQGHQGYQGQQGQPNYGGYGPAGPMYHQQYGLPQYPAQGPYGQQQQYSPNHHQRQQQQHQMPLPHYQQQYPNPNGYGYAYPQHHQQHHHHHGSYQRNAPGHGNTAHGSYNSSPNITSADSSVASSSANPSPGSGPRLSPSPASLNPHSSEFHSGGNSGSVSVPVHNPAPVPGIEVISTSTTMVVSVAAVYMSVLVEVGPPGRTVLDAITADTNVTITHTPFAELNLTENIPCNVTITGSRIGVQSAHNLILEKCRASSAPATAPVATSELTSTPASRSDSTSTSTSTEQSATPPSAPTVETVIAGVVTVSIDSNDAESSSSSVSVAPDAPDAPVNEATDTSV